MIINCIINNSIKYIILYFYLINYFEKAYKYEQLLTLSNAVKSNNIYRETFFLVIVYCNLIILLTKITRYFSFNYLYLHFYAKIEIVDNLAAKIFTVNINRSKR